MSLPERLSAALADRYRIERELGRGGMATVYLADDLKHRRKVAVKVLHPELAEALGAERFLREIETTANLRHPHILPLYDSGDADGFLYYVMPFVEGESLRDRLDREKQLPIDGALAIAREVADALGYAHARGIVHRDIKPENILLEGGHAVVADFGIARAVSAAGEGRITQTGMAVGTPMYMSPEQAAGDRDLDGRSDLYSLGCVLYEMLGGQAPFTGPTVESVVRQHVMTQAAPITNLRPTVPPEVAGALARTLAKNPADRFNPAAQFVQALAPVATTAGPRAPGGWSSRWMGIAAAGTLAVAVGLFLLSRVFLRENVAARYERIAVLPLDNETGDSAQAFFADGMTRELIGVLTDAGVRVLGHRAVVPYRGSALPADRIAKDLGVDALVTGTVLQAGNVVQVAVELTDPESGESLWARTFQRPAPEVVSLQHEVALEIARGIRARLSPEQERSLGDAGRVDPNAYAQYLLGAEQARLRTPDGFRRGIEHLRRSVALDSTFAPAWATMAIASTYALIYQSAPRDSARTLLERAARRAMELDPRLGDPYVALGAALVHMDWDFAGGGEMFRQGRERALSIQAMALEIWIAWELRDWARAIATASHLIEQEPTTAQWRSDLAWGYWSSRDTARARAAARSAVALESDFYEGHDILSLVLADARDFDGAEREHRRAIALAGEDYWVKAFNEGQIAAARGDTASVRRLVRELEGDPRLAQRAGLLYLAGDKDGMYAMLERAVAARDPDLLQVLNAMPFLYPLRPEPRYQALLARMGLPEDQRR